MVRHVCGFVDGRGVCDRARVYVLVWCGGVCCVVCGAFALPICFFSLLQFQLIVETKITARSINFSTDALHFIISTLFSRPRRVFCFVRTGVIATQPPCAAGLVVYVRDESGACDCVCV